MARTKSTRKYGSAADRAKAAAAVAGPGGGGGTMFRNLGQDREYFNPEVPKGKTEVKYTLRLLPYVVSDPKHPDGKDNAPVGDIWYKRSFKRYRGLGPEGNKKPYISPLSIGLPDPVAEYYSKAKADPSIPDEETNKYKPQDCVMYNVQVYDPKEKEFGPVLFWWMSYACFEKRLKKELLDPDNEEFLSFMDLEGGFDVKVRFAKESFAGHDFISADSISFVERDDIDEDILEEVVDLDNVLVVKPYKELQGIFLEIDSDEDNEPKDEQEEKPASRRKKSAEPEDKEEPPARTRRSKTTEPEPEPEPPARRGRAAKQEDPEPEPEKTRTRRGAKTEEPKNPCPEGFVFGDDWDTKKACEKCPEKTFDACEAEFNKSTEPAKGSKTTPAGRSAKGKKTAEDDDNECPSGHVFGTDCDTKPECNDCPKWDACMDRQEEMEG